MDKDTTSTTFKEALHPLNIKKVLEDFIGIDRYVKKLTHEKLVALMIYAQIYQIPSAKQLALTLKNSEELQESVNLSSISSSQLTRRLSDIGADVSQALFSDVVSQMKREIHPRHRLQVMSPIYLVDASIIPLCLSLCRWATYRPKQGKGGLKIHMNVACLPDGTAPEDAVLKPAIHADRTEMNELIVEEGALYLFDRGYNDYEAFDRYCEPETNIRFITRLKSNAVFDVIEEFPVNPDGPITRHARIRLGGGQKQMTHALRLIETHDSEGNLIQLITNDEEGKAEDLGELYRKRWHIELFFKWAKQHLQIKSFYGTSPNAVYNQIWMALITYCLLRLLQVLTGCTQSLFYLLRCVRDDCFKPFKELVKHLHRKPTRTSKGRQRTDPEGEFRRFTELVEKEGLEGAAAVYADVHCG
ncbi:IS4 family transposase [Salicibibacter halophilus]|uniref:IS4 family transposase n=1 Tax=Salicibibacter halophilus TaxID=2502791 RepID=A0A514LJI3_9BACI|nr:IS4 family transposase [Salicibibacter halophilus]QDI90776.1 IS4 family transposase [Salicibibacter halophilus]QDI90819.1 IS4 family transposase [Salicibibacter halophilus]QDI92014.1 IS4 family transposase [Salicibibacter halophilus]QDI92231.1 IS4 family transposase [Salicibibacter halophilus]QDI92554.1 IS4 family transposase [Salicibibacter halophilus]